MNLAALQILRCPYCGWLLKIEISPASKIVDGELETGILGCGCCPYPVVAGIPYLRTGQAARTALRFLDENQEEQALQTLLGVDDSKMDRLRALQKQRRFTFRECLHLLSPNPEGTYFLYRFSDPTFLVTEALVRVLSQDERAFGGRILDLCGGSGHLTRTLCSLAEPDTVWLADLEFWKLWLAGQFVAPQCHAVCCDASQPLPFTRATFSTVICSDAFPFIWPRRLLAAEMTRLTGCDGVVLATQLHNSLCENPSEGSPLEPAAWRNLFDDRPVRLFKESALLDAILENRPLPLSQLCDDAQLSSEPALIALSTSRHSLFRDWLLPKSGTIPERLAPNPLYRLEQIGDEMLLTLQFPSADYESEFQDCLRYLPSRVQLSSSDMGNLRCGILTPALHNLAHQRVLLELPEQYA